MDSIQILTGVEGNIDYFRPRWTKYCHTRSLGRYSLITSKKPCTVQYQKDILIVHYNKS